MTEKTQVTNKLVKSLNSHSNTLVWKRFSGRFGLKGYPDVTGMTSLDINGVKTAIRIEIECKLPGNIPTKIQASHLKRFRALGALCFWCDDYKKGLTEFDRQLNNIKANILKCQTT